MSKPNPKRSIRRATLAALTAEWRSANDIAKQTGHDLTETARVLFDLRRAGLAENRTALSGLWRRRHDDRVAEAAA